MVLNRVEGGLESKTKPQASISYSDSISSAGARQELVGQENGFEEPAKVWAKQKIESMDEADVMLLLSVLNRF